jgi:diguanylate cyclase (GGDEF)-like protein
MVKTDSLSAGASRLKPKLSLLLVSERPDLLSEAAALAAEEFDVRTAAGVGEALQALACGHCDLLLADQPMRPMTGLELLGWAREHYPRAARLLLIDRADIERAGEAISRGQVFAYALQPLRAGSLLPVLALAARHCLRERRRAPLRAGLRWLRLELRRQQREQWRVLQQAVQSLSRDGAELEQDNRRLLRSALEVEQQAMTDPLTGLLNRRAIEGVAEYEAGRRVRYPGPLALGFVDADRFKEVNERFLWPGGDLALVGLAGVLSGSLRVFDRVGRVGGDEFLVVSPQTDVAGAAALAERLRAAVAQTPVSHGGQAVAVTVSVGFAVAEAGETADWGELKRVAAQAAAAAKRAGGNRAVVRALGGPGAGGRREWRPPASAEVQVTPDR